MLTGEKHHEGLNLALFTTLFSKPKTVLGTQRVLIKYLLNECMFTLALFITVTIWKESKQIMVYRYNEIPH